MNKVYFLEILLTDKQLDSIKALAPFFKRVYRRLRIDIPEHDKVVLLVGVKNTVQQGEDRIVELSQNDLLNLDEQELRILLTTAVHTKKTIALIHLCQNRILEEEVKIAEYLQAFNGDELQKRISSYAFSQALLRQN